MLKRDQTNSGSGRWTLSQRPFRTHVRHLSGAFILVSAFGTGLWLGQSPSPGPVTDSRPQAVAELFAVPPKGQTVVQEPAAGEPTSKPGTLRLRATRHVSSREARTGESVLFVTEQPMETKSGQHVPAGALVEGVISEAKRSSTDTPGSLVIEIRALYVGNQSIPLHALPYVPKVASQMEPLRSVESTKPIDIKALGVRTQMRFSPEAIMPKESVIEFELVERAPDGTSGEPFVNPAAPTQQAVPQESPGKPELPLPMETKPTAPLRRSRISVASV